MRHPSQFVTPSGTYSLGLPPPPPPPPAQMIIKGRDHERAKAWALAKAIIQDNEMQSFKVTCNNNEIYLIPINNIYNDEMQRE